MPGNITRGHRGITTHGQIQRIEATERGVDRHGMCEMIHHPGQDGLHTSGKDHPHVQREGQIENHMMMLRGVKRQEAEGQRQEQHKGSNTLT